MGAATSVLFLPCEELPQAHWDALETSLGWPRWADEICDDMIPLYGYSNGEIIVIQWDLGLRYFQTDPYLKIFGTLPNNIYLHGDS
jgi:hypothetical protein